MAPASTSGPSTNFAPASAETGSEGSWTDGGTETIETVAILHRGAIWAVPRPGRHHDVIRRIRDEAPETGPVRGGDAQGFLTSAGRFVDRREGGRIAVAAGQTSALGWGSRLFSEDLW